MSNVWSEGFSKNNNFDKFECNFAPLASLAFVRNTDDRFCVKYQETRKCSNTKKSVDKRGDFLNYPLKCFGTVVSIYIL